MISHAFGWTFECRDGFHGLYHWAYVRFSGVSIGLAMDSRLSCSQDHKEIIHPLVPRASADEQIVGPDYAGRGLNFFIDGKKDVAFPLFSPLFPSILSTFS